MTECTFYGCEKPGCGAFYAPAGRAAQAYCTMHLADMRDHKEVRKFHGINAPFCDVCGEDWVYKTFYGYDYCTHCAQDISAAEADVKLIQHRFPEVVWDPSRK